MPGNASHWTGALDRAPTPFDVAGYLTQSGLSFQEANNLFNWATVVLHKEAAGHNINIEIYADLATSDVIMEGMEWSLEYYEERADQVEEPLEFWDIEPLQGDMTTLIGIEAVAVPAPAHKQKKKCCSHCKMLPSNEEEEYDSLSQDSWGDDDPGPLWHPPEDQMDVNHSGPLQM